MNASGRPANASAKRSNTPASYLALHSASKPIRKLTERSSWLPRVRCTCPGWTCCHAKRVRMVSTELGPRSTKSPLKRYGRASHG
eukprot:6327278-Prymnesium_polylepis.1